MRTITHGSGTTQYEIKTSDENAWVFQPNILVVNLTGSSYVSNQTVSLKVGSTIVFTRNAINKVVMFDLTSLFKSNFTDFSIPLTVGEHTDPFYKSAYEIIISPISDDSQNETISYNLIFGALQVDSPTIQRIHFPFWADMPLSINSGFHCDSMFVDGIEYTGRKLLNIEKTTNFQVVNVLNLETVQHIYYDMRTCPENGYYIRWVDQKGQIWHYKFTKKTDENYTTANKSGESITKYPISFDYLPAFTRSQLLKKTQQRTFSGYANESIEVFNVLETVAQSLFVAVYLNNIWVDVKVKDMTTKSNGEYASDIEIVFELPENYSMEL